MQSILKRLLTSSPMVGDFDGSDSRGFDLADRLEDGESHEVLADWFQPVTHPAMYLMRKSATLNEWIVLDYKSMRFIMRAIMELECNGVFTSNFDPKIAASRGESGRVRIALHLYQAGDPGGAGAEPALVMISDARRSEWKTYKVVCDSCRYQRRRSSYTEGMDEWKREELRERSSSACSFYTPGNLDDFSGLCSVVPSSQEVMRLRHLGMQIHGKDFTRIKVAVPNDGVEWCPISRPTRRVLEESNSHAPHINELMIESKLPVWSESLKSLALEFRHREVLPSRRNFQLVCAPLSDPICQFYRTGKSEYMIEMRPNCEGKLSLVQAFCIALSSALWH